jgi:hypothetical protein
VGANHVKGKRRQRARGRRPRPRICLRKGCGRKYQPRAWNQRYCQEPECRRQVRRWQAARRQARRRQDPKVQAQHAQAESERRQRAKTEPHAVEHPEVTPAHGHAAGTFFSPPCAIGRVAMRRPCVRPATPHTTVVPPAGKPFGTFAIANASGSRAALWMAARSGPMSIEPLATIGSSGTPTVRPILHRGHLLSERHCAPRRSSIIAWPFPG